MIASRTLARFRLATMGFDSQDLQTYRLLDRSDIREALRFLPRTYVKDVFRPQLNGPLELLLEDKWLAFNYLRGLGIPTVQTVGLYHPEVGISMDGEGFSTANEVEAKLASSENRQLVFKPRFGREGTHVNRVQLTPSDHGLRVETDGKYLSIADYLAELAGLADANDRGRFGAGVGGWIVQPVVNQHPAMSRLNPSSLNTVRVITLARADASVSVQMAFARAGRRGSHRDNVSQGGLAIGVDVATGELGQAFYGDSHSLRYLESHPDSGIAFAEVIVPMWGQVRDLCTGAARTLLNVRSIGWDVALTEHGPVILEGNSHWHVRYPQAYSDGYLTDEVRADLADLGLRPPSRVPSTPEAVAIRLGRRFRRALSP